MRAILHIGSEKTGTTSVQSSLQENRDVLSGHGFHVAQSLSGPRHRLLALAFAETRQEAPSDHDAPQHAGRSDEVRRFREAFDHEMSSLPENIHTVIISSEHLQSRLVQQSQVDALGDFLAHYTSSVEVVCYVRPQADMCTSLYSTALKEGFTVTFDEFIGECRPDSHYYNFNTMLHLWRSRFGRSAMRVRLFDRQELRNGDIIEDFYSQLTPAVDHALARSEVRANESLSPGGQAIALAANRTLGPGPAREAVRQIVSHHLSGRGQQMDPQRWTRVQQTFEESNTKVRDLYFPERSALFALNPPPNGASTLEPHFVDVLSMVLTAQQNSLQSHTLGDRFAPLLRDFAISLEASDLESAYTAMELAAAIRPHGVHIHNKLSEYRRRLS